MEIRTMNAPPGWPDSSLFGLIKATTPVFVTVEEPRRPTLFLILVPSETGLYENDEPDWLKYQRFYALSRSAGQQLRLQRVAAAGSEGVVVVTGQQVALLFLVGAGEAAEGLSDACHRHLLRAGMNEPAEAAA